MSKNQTITQAEPPEARSVRKTSFFRNTRGSINIMMAAMMPVVAAGVGVVVDGANLIRVQNNLQESTDAAALAAAVFVIGGEKDNRNGNKIKKGDVEAVAKDYLNNNFRVAGTAGNDQGAKLVKLTQTGDRISVEATYTQSHFIMGMFGQERTEIGARATVGLPDPKGRDIRMSLVLDNSFSMHGGRMSDLKKAATQFVEHFETFDDAKIGIVPFNTYVNVGTENHSKPWIRIYGEGYYGNSECRMQSNETSRTNCRMVQTTYRRDGIETYGTHEQCDVEYGPAYEVCNTPDQRGWSGCVTSRLDGESNKSYYDREKFTGILNVECVFKLTPLMSSKDVKLKNNIDAMSVQADTYIPQGIIWGHMLLDHRAPFGFPGTVASDQAANRYMVVMSDGENTLEAYEFDSADRALDFTRPNGETLPPGDISIHSTATSSLPADTLMKKRCDNAKAEGIRIFTIAIGIDPSSRSYQVLKECASENDDHFAFRDTSQLKFVFKEIADRISSDGSESVRLLK